MPMPSKEIAATTSALLSNCSRARQAENGPSLALSLIASPFRKSFAQRRRSDESRGRIVNRARKMRAGQGPSPPSSPLQGEETEQTAPMRRGS
jgi:hypothetical protein